MEAYISSYAKASASPSALVQMPTGTGKTAVIATLARISKGVGPVLVLSARQAIREQLADEVGGEFFQKVGLDPSKLPKRVVEVPRAALPAKLDGVVVVMTIQLLTRYFAHDRDKFDRLLNAVQLLILDEGHAEPSPLWSSVIRSFQVPRILFTATPYRNDFKPFDIDFTKSFFRYAFDDAIKDRVIRDVKVLDAKHPGNPQAFADQLVALRDKHLPAVDPISKQAPRVIVRCDNLESIRQLAKALRDKGQSVIAIHERLPATPSPSRPWEHRRVPRKKAVDAVFWLHQYKLLEGIDDPRFQMVAMYEALGNTRAIVQQIGRVLRNPTRASGQVAFVVDHTGGEVRRRWERYREFERLNDADASDRLVLTRRVVETSRKSGALIYIDGDLREPLDLLAVDPALDLRLPLSTRVFRKPKNFQIANLVRAIQRSLAEADRAWHAKQLSGDTWIGWFVGVRNSPLLDEKFFLEPRLGVVLVRETKNHVFLLDTGSGYDAQPLVIGFPVDDATLRRALPEDGTTRITAFTLANSNLAADAVRTRAITAVSLASLPPGFDDHFYVPRIAQGRALGLRAGERQPVRRYVGFTNARISDEGAAGVSVSDYLAWVDFIEDRLSTSAKAARLFARYASAVGPPADPEAVSVLLDLWEPIEAGSFVTNDGDAVPLEIEDLCLDVKKGSFTLIANGNSIDAEIEFDPETKRYRVHSPYLDEHYRRADDSIPFAGVTDYLWRSQAIRVLPASEGVLYVGGTFYRPLVEFGSKFDNNQVNFLETLRPIKEMADMTSEKGKKCKADGSGWQDGSVFACLAACGKGTKLSTAMGTPDILVCDDMRTESADFIFAHNLRAVFVHAKASSKRRVCSASALSEPVAQALKNLRYLHPYADERPSKCEDWHTEVWKAPKVKGSVKKRILRGSGTGLQVWSRVREILRRPDSSREVWLVLGNMLSAAAFETQLRSAQPPHEAIQTAYLLDGLLTHTQSVGCRLAVFCSP